MKTETNSTNIKKSRLKFILAAIDDINEHGVADLSMRRVAEKCGMSSGAPYRHFEDRNDLCLAVFQYINTLWINEAKKISNDTSLTARQRLTELSINYIRFLCDHPGFQTILMTNDVSMTEEQRAEKTRLSDISDNLVREYCESVGMDEESSARKIFAVRAYLYGGALMMNSGTMPYNEESLDMMRSLISREFDID